MEQQHVWFNSPLNSAIEITPYSQVYGLHPRFFDFNEEGNMELSAYADTWQRNLTVHQSPAVSPFGRSPIAAGSSPSFPFCLPQAQPVASVGFSMPAGGSPILGQASSTPCHASLRLPMIRPQPANVCIGSQGPSRAQTRGTPHACRAPVGIGDELHGPMPSSLGRCDLGPGSQGSLRCGLPGPFPSRCNSFPLCNSVSSRS